MTIKNERREKNYQEHDRSNEIITKQTDEEADTLSFRTIIDRNRVRNSR